MHSIFIAYSRSFSFCAAKVTDVDGEGWVNMGLLVTRFWTIYLFLKSQFRSFTAQTWQFLWLCKLESRKSQFIAWWMRICVMISTVWIVPPTFVGKKSSKTYIHICIYMILHGIFVLYLSQFLLLRIHILFLEFQFFPMAMPYITIFAG